MSHCCNCRLLPAERPSQNLKSTKKRPCIEELWRILRNHQTESPAAAWTGLSWTWPSQLPVMRLWRRARARSETHLGHPSDSPSDPGDRGGVAVWGQGDGCPAVVTVVGCPRGLHEGNQQKLPRIKPYSCFFATVKSETPAAALGGLQGRGPPCIYIYISALRLIGSLLI